MTVQINKLVIVGAGLIGGSFALALREAGVVRRVVGVGRSPGNLQLALSRGVIDVAESMPSALEGADVVMLAVPVGQTRAVLTEAARWLGPETTLTDAGSTKSDVVAAARDALGPKLHQFVPGHPIAGAEHSGAAAASATLYHHKNVVLTPLAETDPARLELVRQLWHKAGAEVREMDWAHHDRVFAAVSHLPHLLSYALVEDITRKPNAAELFSYAAGGFRDFTRIASSHPDMWRDICLANRPALLTELDAYLSQLQRLRDLLDQGDAASLRHTFAIAKEARDAWLAGQRRAVPVDVGGATAPSPDPHPPQVAELAPPDTGANTASG